MTADQKNRAWGFAFSTAMSAVVCSWAWNSLQQTTSPDALWILGLLTKAILCALIVCRIFAGGYRRRG